MQNKFKTMNEYRISMQKNYFCFCLSQITEYENICHKIHELNNGHVAEDELHIVTMNLSVQYELQEQSVLAPIIFAAMSIEAFLYDYGAINLGDTYMKKHLDKLDIPSKIVLLTKLISGKEFPTDSQAFEGIKNLVKARNELVHFKSKKFESEKLYEASEYRSQLNKNLKKSMYASVEAVRDFMKEMDKIHDTNGLYEYSIEPTQCHA